MSDVDFRELLVQGRVPAAVADALVTAGLNLELFGAVAVSVDALETELARWVDAELLESEAVVMPALRLLFLKHAHPGLLPLSPCFADRQFSSHSSFYVVDGDLRPQVGRSYDLSSEVCF